MDTFITTGENGYACAQITSGIQPVGRLIQRLNVATNVPALYAGISDGTTGACPNTSACQLTITAPDGTTYTTPTNTADLFVSTVNGHLYAMCILNPAPGTWSITVRCTTPTTFRADIHTVPTTDGYSVVMRALLDYCPHTEDTSLDQVAYDLCRWSFWTAGVLFAAATANGMPAINLQNLAAQLLSLDSATAQHLVTSIAGLNPRVAGMSIARATASATPSVTTNVLLNGDGSQGLAMWMILANGGWSVQKGYASSIGYATNFAVADAWCKASQLIDLRDQAGFTQDYLDQAPPITVTDFVAALYPDSSQGQYYLQLELRDSAHNVLKSFTTGMMKVPATGTSPADLRWVRITGVFMDYGPGVRYLYVEHGALNPAKWTSPDYGIKLTGATAAIPVERSVTPSQLLANGSAQQGLVGWSDVSGSAGVWQVEHGPGAQCPGSAGNTNFAISGGWARKYQVIDLLKAGYTDDFLDQAPLVQVSDWVCAYPDCTCQYSLKVELRNAQQQVIKTYDSGTVTVSPSNGNFTPFQRIVQTLSGYGSGLRFIYFEHGGTHTVMPNSVFAAKLTGASVQILGTPGVSNMLAEPGDEQAALAARGLFGSKATPVLDTSQIPYRWVCFLWQTSYGGPRFLGSGFLMSLSPTAPYVVVTAAHNLYNRAWGKNDNRYAGWSKEILVTPGQGKPGGSPYPSYTARGAMLQIGFDYLLKDQAQVQHGNAHDYAAIIIPRREVRWDADGFNLTVETDQQLTKQAGQIAAYPGNYNKNTNPQNYGMYHENITLNPSGSMEITAPSSFTQGASGGPVYVNTSDAVGIYSHGGSFGWEDPSAARINQAVLESIIGWSTPLSPNDLITSLKLIIRTGNDTGAGTDFNIACSFNDHSYDLEQLWIGGVNHWIGGRNESGDFDGYDLTPQLLKFYPTGLHLSQLLGQSYSIYMHPSFFELYTAPSKAWQVECVAIFVNNQLLTVNVCNTWIDWAVDGYTSVNGIFQIG